MALKVAIKESKNVALWCDYKDVDGNVLAEFKIRGDGYQPYKVAIERANNQISAKGFDVAGAGPDDKQFHELLLQAAACHLIEDWKGVEFEEKGEVTAQPYTPEAATKLLSLGDIGIAIWVFVKERAQKIQKEADDREAEVLGKSKSSMSGTAQT